MSQYRSTQHPFLCIYHDNLMKQTLPFFSFTYFALTKSSLKHYSKTKWSYLARFRKIWKHQCCFQRPVTPHSFQLCYFLLLNFHQAMKEYNIHSNCYQFSKQLTVFTKSYEISICSLYSGGQMFSETKCTSFSRTSSQSVTSLLLYMCYPLHAHHIKNQ